METDDERIMEDEEWTFGVMYMHISLWPIVLPLIVLLLMLKGSPESVRQNIAEH